MRPIIVGLLGRAASGKSTAAKYLAEKYNAKIFSFAAPLKELTKLVFKFSDAQIYGTQLQKEAIDIRYGMSPRTAMIRLGDGAREVLWRDVWIKVAIEKITEEHGNTLGWYDKAGKTAPQQIYVIEDVRYPNEAEYLACRFLLPAYNGGCRGLVVKLVCPDGDSDPSYKDAPSEKSVDECNPEHIYTTITSSKSPGSEDLKQKLDVIVRKILEKSK